MSRKVLKWTNKYSGETGYVGTVSKKKGYCSCCIYNIYKRSFVQKKMNFYKLLKNIRNHFHRSYCTAWKWRLIADFLQTPYLSAK